MIRNVVAGFFTSFYVLQARVWLLAAGCCLGSCLVSPHVRLGGGVGHPTEPFISAPVAASLDRLLGALAPSRLPFAKLEPLQRRLAGHPPVASS